MLIGVFIYSFTIGSLASYLSSVDRKIAEFNKKLNVLLDLKKEYQFSNQLYLKIKRALKEGMGSTITYEWALDIIFSII